MRGWHRRLPLMGTFHKVFATQFTEGETGLVYRRNLVGPAIPLSKAEHGAILDAFDARATLSALALILPAISTTVLLIGAILAIHVAQPEKLLLWCAGLIVGSGAVSLLLQWYAFRVPARALAGRAPVADALDRNARRALWRNPGRYDQLSYRALALALVVAMQPLWNLWHHPERFAGWYGAVLIVTLAAIASVLDLLWRKWRYRRSIGTAPPHPL